MTRNAIDGLLQETGMEGDPVLTSFLTEIEQLASVEPPIPSPDIAALMGRTAVKPNRKRSGHRKAVIVVGAVVISLGMGVSAAAAVSPQVRDVTQGAVEFLIHTITSVPVSPVNHPRVPTPDKTHSPSKLSTPTRSDSTHTGNPTGVPESQRGEPSAIPGRGESGIATPNVHATPNPATTQNPNEGHAPRHGSNP